MGNQLDRCCNDPHDSRHRSSSPVFRIMKNPKQQSEYDYISSQYDQSSNNAVQNTRSSITKSSQQQRKFNNVREAFQYQEPKKNTSPNNQIQQQEKRSFLPNFLNQAKNKLTPKNQVTNQEYSPFSSPNAQRQYNPITQSSSSFEERDPYFKFSKEKEGSETKCTIKQDLRNLKLSESFQGTKSSSLNSLNKKFSSEDIKNVYKFGQVVGKGKFGCVRIATHKKNQGKVFAIKSIFRQKLEGHIEQVELEHDIMRTLDHPNIIKIYETYMDQQYFHFVMEYCDGGDLFEMIQKKERFSEEETAKIMMQILKALNHCHFKNICHRDLKPENIVFSQKCIEPSFLSEEDLEVKIIDFGLSKYLIGNNDLTSKVGTPYYVAPEVLDGKYDTRCDYWSAGVIAFTMLVGYPPFFANSLQDIFRKIRTCEYDFNPRDWANISEEAQDFISRLIVRDSSRRLSALEALNHPWILMYTGSTPYNKRQRHGIIERFKQFKRQRLLKKEALKILIQQFESSTTQQLKQEFNEIDKNQQGLLEIDELLEYFRQNGYEMSRDEVKSIFMKIKRKKRRLSRQLSDKQKKEVMTQQEMEMMEIPSLAQYEQAKSDDSHDSQGDQQVDHEDELSNLAITYTDFLMVTYELKNLSKAELFNVFKHLDIDNKGVITYQSLLKFFNRTSRDNSEQESLKLMQELNMNENDEITFDQFYATVMTQHSFCSDLNESIKTCFNQSQFLHQSNMYHKQESEDFESYLNEYKLLDKVHEKH